MAVKGLRSSFKQVIVALVFHLCLYLSPNTNKFKKKPHPIFLLLLLINREMNEYVPVV